MYKFILIKFFLTVILILSSCSYNEIGVRKKNIQADKANKLILYTNKNCRYIYSLYLFYMNLNDIHKDKYK